MSITFAAFVITILASLSVGLVMLRRSSRNQAWLLKIEAQRRIRPER